MRQQLQLLLTGCLVLLLGYVGYQMVFAEAGVEQLVVVAAENAQLLNEETPDGESVSSGMVLDVRDRVVTGEAGSVTMLFGESGQLRLSPESSIRVLGADGGGVRVELDEGAVSARVRPGSPPLGIASRGRAVHATDAAFTVMVDAEGGLAARSDGGRVLLRGFDGATELVPGTVVRALPGKPLVAQEVSEELLLEVDWPDVEITRSAEVLVQGKTDPYAAVIIGGGEKRQRIRASADGSFQSRVLLSEGENAMRIHVRDLMGREIDASRSILRDSTAPVVEGAKVVWGR